LNIGADKTAAGQREKNRAEMQTAAQLLAKHAPPSGGTQKR
jgi:hypothetical protein